jgi:hypothetical protein
LVGKPEEKHHFEYLDVNRRMFERILKIRIESGGELV